MDSMDDHKLTPSREKTEITPINPVFEHPIGLTVRWCNPGAINPKISVSKPTWGFTLYIGEYKGKIVLSSGFIPFRTPVFQVKLAS